MKIMNLKKILGILMSATILVSVLASMPASAEDAADSEDAEAEAEQTGTGYCMSDYYSFVGTVRSPESTAEYMKDFLRSYCKINDLLELYEELDEVRDGFRTAAYNCNDTLDYKKDYKRLLMEMSFIRNLQKVNSGTLSEEEAEDIEKQKETLLNNLEWEMKIEFVNDDYVSETDFENYFAVWRAKYDDRVAAYAMCDEGPLSEIKGTFTDFVETLSNLDFEIDKPSKEQSFWEKLKPDFDVDATTVGIFDYVKSAFQKSEDELGPAPSVEDLKEEGQLTFNSALLLLEESNSVYSAAYASGQRMDKYRLLYGEGSALGVTDMQSVIRTINAIIEEANAKDLPYIQAATSKVFDKQCN